MKLKKLTAKQLGMIAIGGAIIGLVTRETTVIHKAMKSIFITINDEQLPACY
ncbi:MAG: hypothetical protein KIT27_10845 [Legionellales bacterium]|nr:hypothetical protein [Legionellales bacterium]